MSESAVPETFTWVAPSGAEITLPTAATIKAGLLRRVRKMEPLDAMFEVIETIVDDEALAAIDELRVDEINALFTAWQGAALPES